MVLAPAMNVLTADGASPYAAGSQACSGKTAILTAEADEDEDHRGMQRPVVRRRPVSRCARSAMFSVPVTAYASPMPISTNIAPTVPITR